MRAVKVFQHVVHPVPGVVVHPVRLSHLRLQRAECEGGQQVEVGARVAVVLRVEVLRDALDALDADVTRQALVDALDSVRLVN